MKQNKPIWLMLLFSIIFISLISFVYVVIATVISSNQVTSNQLSTGTTTLNDSGLFYSNTKAFSRTADVTIARGLNASDDLDKLFKYDVVCLSTDNDCHLKLYNAVKYAKSKVIITQGIYPMLSYSSFNYRNTSIGVPSNVHLECQNATFDINISNVPEGYSAIGIHSTSNIKISGCTINGNNMDKSLIPQTYGIYVSGQNNLIENNHVYNMTAYQMFCGGGSFNKFLNNKLIGMGRADVFGGGCSNAIVSNNYIEQTNSLSTYNGSLVWTGASYNQFINNLVVNGFISFSTEASINKFNKIHGNIIRGNQQYCIWLTAPNTKHSFISITDNICYGSNILVNADNSSINNNFIDINDSSKDCLYLREGSNLMVKDNILFNCNNGITIGESSSDKIDYSYITDNYIFSYIKSGINYTSGNNNKIYDNDGGSIGGGSNVGINNLFNKKEYTGLSLDSLLFYFNGNNFIDYSGNGNNATNNGSTFVDGLFGKAYNFSSGQSIYLNAIPNVNFSHDFSVNMWFKTTTTSGTQTLFGNTAQTASRMGIAFSSSTIRAGIYNGSWYGGASSTTLGSNSWYHVSYNFDSTSKTAQLYINGILQTGTTNPNVGGVVKASIGSRTDNTDYANAIIDEIIIFDRTLNSNEINNLYLKNIEIVPFDAFPVKKSNLTGIGNVLACIDSNGYLYRGNATGCP